MKILITGGAGFVGSNLVEYLIKNRCAEGIVVYDNLSACGTEYLREITGADFKDGEETEGGGVRFIKGDILDADLVFEACGGVDAVVHLAAHTDVVESMEKPEMSFNINVGGSINVLEAANRRGVKKFVFASSNAAVGEAPQPIGEESAAVPISPYGSGKLAGEALCGLYSRSYGMSITSLRFANAYGIYSEHKASVIPKMLKEIIGGEGLVVYGDGNQTRDYVHARDIARAIIMSLDKVNGYELFQVASGIETSVNEVVEMICSATGARPDVSYEPARPGEIYGNYSSIGKIRRVLGFSPEVNLQDGIRELYNRFLKTVK